MSAAAAGQRDGPPASNQDGDSGSPRNQTNDKPSEHGGEHNDKKANPDPSEAADSHAHSQSATAAEASTEEKQPDKEFKEDADGNLRKRTSIGAAIQGSPSDLKSKLVDQKEKIKDKKNPPGGYDDTPLPDFPAGYTVKFTFHKAWNLPAADFHNAAADPYVHATLTAAVPRRHKEDPLMVYRTRTMRRTLEPEWEQEWVVANIPASGFRLKCRLYDEDYPDHDDRLGNLTYVAEHVDEQWQGVRRETIGLKKRMGSKRAYLVKAATSLLSRDHDMTPHMEISIEVLGRSEGPGAQMYTMGPTAWIKHFSPMIGRLTGIKVNKDEKHDENGDTDDGEDSRSKRYDFQANEIQLQGPVPPKLYHRYVEFRPVIGLMFSSNGLRGKILNKALHKQHNRIYNYDSTTQYGTFEPCSQEASLQFLKMAHFDEGGRTFTYVLTLDGLMRFTETGKEFGIDLLSKHTMHSDVALYIACSGEFFIRRLEKPNASPDLKPQQATHPSQDLPGGPPESPPPRDPSYYQLVIDNDSGTYRPDKKVLPQLKEFLERNLPGLGIVAMHWEDEELQRLKENQAKIKKKEGPPMRMVLNRSPSSSSFSSSDESRLGDLVGHGEGEDGDGNAGGGGGGARFRSKKERAWDIVEDPSRLKGEWERVKGSSQKELPVREKGGGAEGGAEGTKN
ncbi:uncharacterized protein E0L32_004186 [Thyridium curvatum]|uniref:C2 domain-containing protein n=1 Tax=Thyridium curvatum TaxID=1093900 RepID=A0A507BGS7_9PEZI|nr:uncharacterized protein E0L32_004186 [Thyridium curvatum]TPX16191.1 hypothetical protein E0L32_004186 [Thyridium curvatum]